MEINLHLKSRALLRSEAKSRATTLHTAAPEGGKEAKSQTLGRLSLQEQSGASAIAF